MSQQSTRATLIDTYEAAASSLREAVGDVPQAALSWKPSPQEFSIQEIVWHVADGEVVNSSRLGYVLAERDTTITGYDEQSWVRSLRYAERPIADALTLFEAMRAANRSLLRTLPDDAWNRSAPHSEGGVFTVEAFLQRTAVHLSGHAAQIDETLAAWHARPTASEEVAR